MTYVLVDISKVSAKSTITIQYMADKFSQLTSAAAERNRFSISVGPEFITGNIFR